MAILKLVLDQRRAKKDGTYPLKIRIRYSFKTYYYALGISILPNQWDEAQKQITKHSNSKLLNAKVNQEYSKVEQLILNAERINEDLSMADIKDLLNPKKQAIELPNDIIGFGEMLIKQQQEAGRWGNATTYQTALDLLEKQFSNKPISFESIDFAFLNNWEALMRNKGVKVNSIGAYMRSIRAIYNQAIKNELVEIKHYPFSKYKIKSERTIQRTLSKEQINEIRGLKLKQDTKMLKARDLLMLSFYFRGMNFRDMALLTKESIQGDRIIYRRQKTHKVYSIKIIPQAQILLDKYASTNKFLLLSIIPDEHCGDRENQILSAKKKLKNYNSGYYHKIGEKIGVGKMTTYYARYSWANIARKLGYSKDLIAEALGHEYGNRVTGIYLDNYDLEVIDEMNERVCS